QVAVLFRDAAPFDDTVGASLCLGREGSHADGWRAEEGAQLADAERQVPERADTGVGRAGVAQCGGQGQRLAVARLVLAEPRVVIPDEATSALDVVTEFALHQALGRFLEGRTTLITAHRLSAVNHAARVLVFDGGRIAEEGNHQQLIDEGGLYARLYGHLQH